MAFERLERALEKQAQARFSTAPDILWWMPPMRPSCSAIFLDRIRPIGLIEKYPRLKAWAETLIKRPSTDSFPEAEFEAMYRANVKRRNKWVSQFIADVAVAAE